MDFVRVGTPITHARRDGDPSAAPLVLINALGTDLRIWERVVAYLADRCFVVRYDQRGHGLSGLDGQAMSLEALADDLATLLDQLDTGPSLVCGLGLGGLIALALSRYRPELVRGLCLLDTAADQRAADEFRARFSGAGAEDLEAIADEVMREWFSAAFLAQRRDEVLGWRTMLVRTPCAAYELGLGAIAATDAARATASPRVPALAIIGGARSEAHRARAHALARSIDGCDVQEITGAGHLMPVSHAGPVAAALLGLQEQVHLRQPRGSSVAL